MSLQRWCGATILLGLAWVSIHAAASPEAETGLPAALEARFLRAEERRALDDALLAMASDDRAAVRRRLARAVGRVDPAGGLPVLRTLLDDSVPSVRAEAATALGWLGETSALPLLGTVAGDEAAEVRESVATALGHLGSADARVPLRALLDDRDPEVVSAACLAAARFLDPTFALEPLLVHALSSDDRVAFGAAYALARASSAGRKPGPVAGVGVSASDRRKIRDLMVGLASHGSAEVRIQVARSLATPTNTVHISTLGAMLSDRDPRVRIAAVSSLAYTGGPVKPHLAGALGDPHAHVLGAAVEGIGRTQTADTSKLLLGVLGSDRPGWLRALAVGPLSRIDPTGAASRAASLVEEDDPALREAAIRTLAGRTDLETLVFARRLVEDPTPRVAASAVDVLRRAGWSGALRPLIAGAVYSHEPLVRAAAARAAGDRLRAGPSRPRGKEAVGLLGELWTRAGKDGPAVARRAVLDAAAQGGPDPAVRRLLLAGLDDSDRRVRLRAAELLKRLFREDHTARTLPAPSRSREEYEEIARWASRPRAAVVTVQREGFRPGRFTVRLNASEAPLTAWNFWRLAESGFYDGQPIHRLVPGFVVECGEPGGDGFGGPGHSVRSEPSRIAFDAGALAMAGDGDEIHGSRWFVTFSAQPHLARRFTAFGQVVQNFGGVVLRLEPGDRVVSIEVYEGDGTESLPPLE